MGTPVAYEREGSVATIAMDDGKVNALSLTMLGEINGALDQAEQDGAVVVLTGRAGVFSAGFDLARLNAGGHDSAAMVLAGFELAHRVLSFPTPVVIASSGHAIAMGVFLLLSGDYRLGVAGAAHKITANEVAIGLTVPRAAVEICRQRLTPAAFNRAVLLAEPFTPDSAVEAGFLDAVVPAADLLTTAQATASRLAGLDLRAHAATKRRAREGALTAVRAAIDADRAEFLAHV
jgi:enoyl-CoA hydratase